MLLESTDEAMGLLYQALCIIFNQRLIMEKNKQERADKRAPFLMHSMR